MDDTDGLLARTTERLLAEQVDDAAMRAAASGVWLEQAWSAAAELGLPLAMVEGEQGFGVALSDGFALIRLLGSRAIPLPLAETMVANLLLARAGLPVAEGVVALIPAAAGVRLDRQGEGWRARGVADRVAWGRNAAALVVEDDGRIALLTSGFEVSAAGTNLAQMPRDQLTIDGAAQVASWPGLTLLEAGALVRAVAAAGAMETLVQLCTTHVVERTQFGRAISGFQVVQHALARLASEAAAAAAAADLAVDAFVASAADAGLAIAAARSRVGEAVGVATGIAHQLHGAMGFTEEHRLHWFTTALWSWRDEFGSAGWWTRHLGAAMLARPKAAYWPTVTAV